MSCVWDTDSDETYRNEPADMARVAHMAHQRLTPAELPDVLGMLFGVGA